MEKRVAGFFIPWVTDGDKFLDNSEYENYSNAKFSKIELVEPKAVAPFGDTGVLAVCGARGTGKTCLLLKKSARLLAESSREKYCTLHENPPRTINTLAQSTIAVPEKQYGRLSSPNVWVNYWRLVLLSHYACMILRRNNVTNVGDTDHILKHHFKVTNKGSHNNKELTAYDFFKIVWVKSKNAESIGPSLVALVKFGTNDFQVERWLERATEIIDNELDSDVKYTIFVDAIDEAIGSPDGKSLYRYNFNKVRNESEEDAGYQRSVAEDIWLYAQAGFIEAADNIHNQYQRKNLTTYGAVRSEAGAYFMDPSKTGKNRAKTQDVTVTTLSYSRELLEEIFSLNVLYTPTKELFSSVIDVVRESPSFALFGFNKLTHSLVLGESESIEQIIIRHTFNAPRELVFIAIKAIRACPKPEMRPRSLNVIISAIDDGAVEIFNDYISAVRPLWNESLDGLIKKLTKNIYSKSEVDDFEKEHNCSGFFAALYSRGVAGVPSWKTTISKSVQKFLIPTGREEQLPQECNYTFLHPALSSHICDQKLDNSFRANFYSSNLIIGDGLRCPRVLHDQKVRMMYDAAEDIFSIHIHGEHVRIRNYSAEKLHNNSGPSEHEKASALILALIIGSCKRKNKSVAEFSDLESEAITLEKLNIYRGDLLKRKVSEFPRVHLDKEHKSGYLITLRKCLSDYGLGIRVSNDSTHFELCWKNDETTQQRWSRVQPLEMEVIWDRTRTVLC